MSSFLDQLAKLKEEIATSDFEKINYLKLPSNKSLRLRILPGVDEEAFVSVGRIHYNVSIENPKMYIPCQKSKDPRAACPICIEAAKLEASDNKVDKEQAKKIRSQQKFYMNVVPREGEQAGKTVIWTIPKTVLSSVIELCENPEYGQVYDIISGFDLYVKKVGEGRETKYSLTASRNPSPLDEDGDIIQELLDTRVKLSRFADPPSVDETVAMLNGDIKFFTTGGFGRPKEVEEVKNTPSDSEAESDTTPAPVEEEEKPILAPKPAPATKTNLTDLKARFKT